MAELEIVELPIDAVPGEQLGVRSCFEDAALVHHDDEVGALDRREAVCDADGGAPHHEFLDHGLDGAFGFGIEGAGRLV